VAVELKKKRDLFLVGIALTRALRPCCHGLFFILLRRRQTTQQKQAIRQMRNFFVQGGGSPHTQYRHQPSHNMIACICSVCWSFVPMLLYNVVYTHRRRQLILRKCSFGLLSSSVTMRIRIDDFFGIGAK